MTTKDEQLDLANAMHRLAKTEGLELTQVMFRAPYKGMKRRLGTHLLRRKNLGSYNIEIHRIILYLTKANFVLDEFGFYHDKKGNKYSRLTRGKIIPFPELVETAAHEIAHIKYRDHSRKHKIYTQELFEKLKLELGELWQKKNISLEATNTLAI